MSGSAWRGPAPAEITAWSLVQAGHALGRRFWAVLAEVGLTPIQFGTLLQLDLQPDLSNAALARIVLVTPQSMSELLSGLAEQGLVDRSAPTRRGRPVTARLTTAGRQRLRRCEPLIAGIEESLGLSASELRTVNRLLHKALAAGAT